MTTLAYSWHTISPKLTVKIILLNGIRIKRQERVGCVVSGRGMMIFHCGNPNPPVSRDRSPLLKNVNKFFSVYMEVLSRGNFPPSKIYNIDETGISTIHMPPKILGLKGQKQLGAMTSGERGSNITMINAMGNTVPPLFVSLYQFCRINYAKGSTTRFY